MKKAIGGITLLVGLSMAALNAALTLRGILVILGIAGDCAIGGDGAAVSGVSACHHPMVVRVLHQGPQASRR